MPQPGRFAQSLERPSCVQGHSPCLCKAQSHPPPAHLCWSCWRCCGWVQGPDMPVVPVFTSWRECHASRLRVARCSHQVQTRSQINFGALAAERFLGKSCRGQSKLRPSCRLRNLWVASAISSVLPALVLLSAAQKSLLKPRVLELHPLSPRLLPWLIPDRKQTEKLMKDSGAVGTLLQSAETRTRPAGKDDDVSVTRGSLWRRITGQE